MSAATGIDGFTDRLSLVIGESTPYAFAKKCGMGDSTFRPYLDGALPGIEKLVTIARAGGVSVHWLATGEGPMSSPLGGSAQLVETEPRAGGEGETRQSPDQEPGVVPARQSPDPDKFVRVPLVPAKLSSENSEFVSGEDGPGDYAFRREWLTRVASDIENVILVMMMGSSMFPTLKEKDLVMIDRGQTAIIDELIYAIRMDDTVMIKRLGHRPGDMIKVFSDNREYESYQARRQEIQVVGRVIWSCHSY